MVRHGGRAQGERTGPGGRISLRFLRFYGSRWLGYRGEGGRQGEPTKVRFLEVSGQSSCWEGLLPGAEDPAKIQSLIEILRFLIKKKGGAVALEFVNIFLPGFLGRFLPRGTVHCMP